MVSALNILIFFFSSVQTLSLEGPCECFVPGFFSLRRLGMVWNFVRSTIFGFQVSPYSSSRSRPWVTFRNPSAQIGILRDSCLEASSQCASHYSFRCPKICVVYFETPTCDGVKFAGRLLSVFISFSLFSEVPDPDSRCMPTLAVVSPLRWIPSRPRNPFCSFSLTNLQLLCESESVITTSQSVRPPS